MNNNYIKEAIKEAEKNENNDFQDGGPFGCVIVKDNKIIARARNTVLKSNDPTAHAEINAIRIACKKLETHSLSSCKLYTSCFPCPMCLSAIIWANIKEVYYANDKEDAEEIGFRDDDIYDFINGKEKSMLKLKQIDDEEAIKSFDDFKKNKFKKIY